MLKAIARVVSFGCAGTTFVPSVKAVRERQAPELAALSEDTSFIEDSTHACGTDPSDQNEIPLPESMQASKEVRSWKMM